MTLPNHQKIPVSGGGTVYQSYPIPTQKIPPQQTPLLNSDGTISAIWYRFLFAPWFSNTDKNGNQTGQVRADNANFNTITLGGVSVPIPTKGSVIPVSPPGTGNAYVAPSSGTLLVSNGTVTAAYFSRDGLINIPLNLPVGPVPMSAGDTVSVVYTVAPTFNFVPY